MFRKTNKHLSCYISYNCTHKIFYQFVEREGGLPGEAEFGIRDR